MPAEHQDQLIEVFTRVAERITFMFAEPAEKDSIEAPASEFRRVHIAFNGDFAGELTMWIPLDARTEITANVLGEDEDECEATDDTLGELMNMVCGNFLTQIVGYEGVLNLTPPECESAPEEFAPLVDDPETIALLLDEHPVFLKVTLHGQKTQGTEGNKVA